MRIAVILLIVVVGIGALLYEQTQTDPPRVSGFVEADEIRVGSRVGGRVKTVHVEEGDEVEANALLISLEPYDLHERLAEAQAQLAALTATYEKLTAGFRTEEVAEAAAMRDQAKAEYDQALAGPRDQEIKAAKDNLQLATAELELADISYKRAENLFGKKSVSKEDLDHATTERKVAQARVDARREELQMLQEGTRKEIIAAAKAKLAAMEAQWQLRKNGFRKEEIEEGKARMEAARASTEAIKEQIAELEIRAPTKSTVEAVEIRPGDLIAANAPVLSLMDTGRLWVRTYIPGKYHALVEPGQELSVMVESLPNERFTGHVSYIARQAEFTPSNVQTPEERSKQVFRMKVQLDPNQRKFLPGMNADVYLPEPQGE